MAEIGTGAMRKSGGFRDILQVMVFFLLAVAVAAMLSAYNRTELVGTARVIDGDSLQLDGEEIRLFGIDAPEYQQECKTASGGTYSCGKRASDYLRALLVGQEVTCSGSDRDRYERLLAKCLAGSTDVAKRMVFEGWAVSFGAYADEELNARQGGRGIWNGEFQNPGAWRRDQDDAYKGGFLSGLSQ